MDSAPVAGVVTSFQAHDMAGLWITLGRLNSHGKLLKDEVTSENLSPISGCAQLLRNVFFDFCRIRILIHFNPSLIVFDRFHPFRNK